jgi:DNA-binding CsgD family transcriptional regulator
MPFGSDGNLSRQGEIAALKVIGMSDEEIAEIVDDESKED